MTPFEQFLAENKNKMIEDKPAPQVAAPKDISRGEVKDVAVDTTKVRSTSSPIDVQSAQQAQAMGMAQAAAEGKTPSFAEQLLRRQSEQALKQQASAMAGRAFDPAAVRQAQLAGAQAQMAAGEQAAALRAQEMAQARGEFAGLATQARGQDITLAQANQAAELQARAQDIQMVDTDLRAKLANQGVDLEVLKTNALRGDQAAMANLEAQLKSIGMNDARIANYMQGVQALDQARQQAEQFGQTLGFQREQMAQQGAQFGQNLQFQREGLDVQRAAQAAEQRRFEEQLALQAELARQQRADKTGDWWREIGTTVIGGFVGGAAAAAGKAATTPKTA